MTTVVEEILKKRKLTVNSLAQEVLDRLQLLGLKREVSFDDPKLLADIASKLKNSKRRETLPKSPYLRKAITSLAFTEKYKDPKEVTAEDFYRIVVKDPKSDLKRAVKYELSTISLASLEDFQYTKFYKLLEARGVGKYSERDYCQTLCILIASRIPNFSFRKDGWQDTISGMILELITKLKLRSIDSIFRESNVFELPLSRVTATVRIEAYKAVIRELVLLK